MHKFCYRPNVVTEKIKNIFIQYENIEQYNTRHKRDFHTVPILTAAYGKRTIAYEDRKLWNPLSKDLKKQMTHYFFTAKLEDQFLKMYD